MSPARQYKYRFAAIIAIAAMCLHVAIPQGFMPAPLAQGWFLQLCPEGLSAETMRALLGDAHQHHGGHAGHHDHAGHGGALTAPDASPTIQTCDLSLLSADTLAVGIAAAISLSFFRIAAPPGAPIAWVSRTHADHQPRAPPTLQHYVS